MNHKGANANCETCHPTGFSSYTCYACHKQDKIIRHHQEKEISNVSNCVACHPVGEQEDDD